MFDDPEAHCHSRGTPRDRSAAVSVQDHSGREIRDYLSRSQCTTSGSFPMDRRRIRETTWAWDGIPAANGKAIRCRRREQLQRRTWLDMEGNFVDENEHVVERYNARSIRHHCRQYEAGP